ncbi:adenosylcobinamide-GDP ribazoletransferase [Metallosphaera hakonensis]|uniref:adenosylcobinamide-GDP ribazoletransferase n=1 Tax=Metallosphaera hakonensis TaxID=79601 RepID=UPI000B0D0463|nr:adenosylcobinamide-GDP ribazoletransferase [Metallosphaera hakonensis]
MGKTDFELTMEYSFLAPIIVGLVTGGIDYIVLRGLYLVLGGVVSILLIPIVEIIRGFNHLDGLLDFGDALMIRGSSEDRRKA